MTNPTDKKGDVPVAICLRCNKKVSLFKPLKLYADGFCPECAQIIRDEKRRAEEAEQRRIEQEKRKAEQEELLRELKKPFEPPEAMSGYVLAYSYTDVEFDSPPTLRSAAQKVPPRKQITFKYGDGENEIELWLDDTMLGTMRDNKLRSMFIEFVEEDGKDILGVTQYWTDKPVFSLYFYLSVKEFFGRWQRRPDYKTFKLTGNKNSEMQETIEMCCPGESVDYVEYDDKYFVYHDGDGIGNMPASFARYCESQDDLEMRIYDIPETDSGKYDVVVAVIPAE